MNIIVQEMTVRDDEEVFALWQASEGVGLSDADSKESFARFLERNPGLSFVARKGDLLVGAVLCDHDGRRGYIHHLAVTEFHRREGVGRTLVERCFSALKSVGIQKCHIFVFAENHNAIGFWKNIGWRERVELTMMSHEISKNT